MQWVDLHMHAIAGFHLPSAPHTALVLLAGINPGLHLKNISAPWNVFWYASMEPFLGTGGSPQFAGNNQHVLQSNRIANNMCTCTISEWVKCPAWQGIKLPLSYIALFPGFNLLQIFDYLHMVSDQKAGGREDLLFPPIVQLACSVIISVFHFGNYCTLHRCICADNLLAILTWTGPIPILTVAMVAPLFPLQLVATILTVCITL